MLYRLASTYLGYLDGDIQPFWYELDTLCLHVLFESKQNADYFQRRISDETLVHNSPVGHLVVSVSLSESQNPVGKTILTSDYDPDETDSPPVNLSLVSGTTSILDSSRPLFQFQRIESDSVFGQHYKAESCHLIDRAYYLHHPDETDDIENNRLALSSDAHNWFDGKNVDIPLFKLTVSGVSRRIVLENRFEVTLVVTAFDKDSARMLFPRLREGYRKNSETEAELAVYVLEPNIFKACIAWKSSRIQDEWNKYNCMEAAVS